MQFTKSFIHSLPITHVCMCLYVSACVYVTTKYSHPLKVGQLYNPFVSDVRINDAGNKVFLRNSNCISSTSLKFYGSNLR